jgi:hypothetical protein
MVNILAEAKTFPKWSIGKGHLRTNPLETVQGTGKRRHGKPQLRIDEARKWQVKAVQLMAEEGEDRAVAALVTFGQRLRRGSARTRWRRQWGTRARLNGKRLLLKRFLAANAAKKTSTISWS